MNVASVTRAIVTVTNAQFMTEKRINVGITESVHGRAAIASGIAGQDLQDFVTQAASERAESVILDFQSQGSRKVNKVKAPRHSHCDKAAFSK